MVPRSTPLDGESSRKPCGTGANSSPLAGSVLPLAEAAPIASGQQRDVYPVPAQPDMVVKVVRDPRPPSSERFIKRMVRTIAPDTRFRVFLIDAFLEMKVAARLGANGPESPLPKCFGIVATDLGPGVLVERIADADGALAPRLVEVHRRNGLDDEVLALLNVFASRLYALDIVAGDLHEGNLVLGWRNGEKRLFLIDGFGDRHAIPVRTWSRRLNARSLSRRFANMARRMDLEWHPDERRFTFAADT